LFFIETDTVSGLREAESDGRLRMRGGKQFRARLCRH